MSVELQIPVTATLAVRAFEAAKVARWIAHCGSVAVWGSLDLSSASREWLTPAQLTDGSAASPPHWNAPRQPKRVVDNIGQIDVVSHREASRVRIDIHRDGYGRRWRLTDASSRRLRRALEQAGPTAVHVFEGGDAVVHVEASRVPLAGWLREHADAGP